MTLFQYNTVVVQKFRFDLADLIEQVVHISTIQHAAFQDLVLPAFNPLYKSQCIFSIHVIKENFCFSSIVGRVSRRSSVTKYIKIQTEGTASELNETLNRGT